MKVQTVSAALAPPTAASQALDVGGETGGAAASRLYTESMSVAVGIFI